jgi:hypothetical protein
MGWIYFQELVESDLHSNPGCEPLHIVNKTDTHKAFYCHECNQVKLIELPSGMMSPRLEQICCPGSTSSVEAFPAKTSASQDVEKAWMESEAVFSSRSQDSSESADQLSFFSRTSLPSEPVEGKEWSKNWPRSGMTVGGRLYQPQQLEPTIKEKDGSYLPTPTASEHKARIQGNSQQSHCLSAMAKRGERFEQRIRIDQEMRNPSYESKVAGMDKVTLLDEMIRFQDEQIKTREPSREQLIRGRILFQALLRTAETDELRKLSGDYKTRLEDEYKSNYWAVEPNVGRVVNGLPDRAHRIKCLGNSVVPFQVREAFKKLAGIN